MDDKYHVASAIYDDCIGVSCSAVKKLFHVLNRPFCRVGLLGDNGAEGCEHCKINCTCVVEKRARDFLNELLIGFAEEGRIVVIWCILLLGSLDCFDVSV